MNKKETLRIPNLERRSESREDNLQKKEKFKRNLNAKSSFGSE